MKFIVQEWIKRITSYPKLISDYDMQAITLNHIREENQRLQIQIDELQDKLQKTKINIVNEQNNENVHNSEYWNNKWEKSIIFYKAPNKIKVTEYLKDENYKDIKVIANDIINEFKLSDNNVDSIPLAVMKWINDKFNKKEFKYVNDKSENWQSPIQTLQLKQGDCDDFGILEYNVIREIFKQLNVWNRVDHRLKCVCGNVNNKGSIPSVNGGHFYLIWLHSNGEWFVVETTYFRPLSIVNYDNLPHKMNPMYGIIWFSFNESHSWNSHSLVVTKEDFKKLR